MTAWAVLNSTGTYLGMVFCPTAEQAVRMMPHAAKAVPNDQYKGPRYKKPRKIVMPRKRPK